MELTINIYNRTGKEIERTAKGETVDIMLGTIEAIMDVLDIDNIQDDNKILKSVSSAYKELRIILSDVFGDITKEEWKRVKLKEIVPIVMLIVKYTFLQMEKLPSEGKN